MSGTNLEQSERTEKEKGKEEWERERE